jgi:hypothetical protein
VQDADVNSRIDAASAELAHALTLTYKHNISSSFMLQGAGG